LSVGDFSLVEARGDVLAYERSFAGERLLVVLNFGAAAQEVDIPLPGPVLLSTHARDRAVGAPFILGPNQGAVFGPEAAGPA
jgi:alpha-glucosidase